MRTNKARLIRSLLVLAPLALGGCLNVDTTHPAQPTSTTVVVPPTSSTTSTTTTTVCPSGAPAPC